MCESYILTSRGVFFMKNSKKFLLLAIAATSLLSNACDEANNASDPIKEEVSITFEPVTSDVIILQPSDSNDRDEQRPYLAQLFHDCYRHNDTKACQKLALFTAYQLLHERQLSAELIHSQEKTNATLRESLDLSHERERRKMAKINKRKQAKKDIQKAD